MNETVRLPEDPDEIIRRLSKVSSEQNLVQKLYSVIAENAGEELLPSGVVTMFILVINDLEHQYPPPFGNILIKFIPLWIDAIIDDKVFAEKAKKLLKELEDEVEEELKAKTPPRVEHTGPVEDFNLYLAVRKAVDIFFEEIERCDAKHSISVHRNEDDANSFYSQTESGLFVEYSYGQPSKIWTPWGYFSFTGSLSYTGDAPWEEILNNFLERLGATLYIPERNESYGVFGPIYAIHKVDNIILPEPLVREQQNYLEYKVAKNAWKNMTRHYRLKTFFKRIWRKFRHHY